MENGRQIRWNGWGPRNAAPPESFWRWLAGALSMPALLATPPRAFADMALPPVRLPGETLQKFAAFGIRRDDEARVRHAAGRSLTDLLRLRAGDISTAPDGVLYPRSEFEVLAVLALCAELDIAVVPFGGGTSLVGGVTPPGDRPSLAMDMTRMDRVTSLDAMSGLAVAEAGITGPELERQLGARGMMLGHRPDSFEYSTLGGWIAHAGSGQDAARYGRAADWLAGLRVATPAGLFTARETPASALGPDLKQLMLGSDGILGVITSASLRVRALPAAEDWRGYVFPDFASGLAAIREAQRQGLPHAMLRLSDATHTRLHQALDRARHPFDARRMATDAWLRLRGFDHKACLLTAGFAGRTGEVARGRKGFDALARRMEAARLGAQPRWPTERYGAPYLRDVLLDRGLGHDAIEVSANWATLPGLYAALRHALQRAMRDHVPRAGAQGLVLAHTANAYPDGAALNVSWIYPRLLEDDLAQAAAIRAAALDAVTEAGGSISHAWGTGSAYRGRMEAEKSAQGVAALAAVKQALDPRGILNPGKLLP